MPRGAGVTRIRGADHTPPLPEGREGGDARGATWPIVLMVAGLIVGPSIGALMLGSLVLYRDGRPIGPWIGSLRDPLLALVGAAFTVLMTKVLNNAGRGLRNQQTLAANQDAVYRLMKNAADGVIALGERVGAIERWASERQQGDDVAKELANATQALRDLTAETGAKLGRAVATITGQQRALPTRSEPAFDGESLASTGSSTAAYSQEQAHPPSRRAQDPLDTSQPWHTGDTGAQPVVPGERSDQVTPRFPRVPRR